MNRSELKVQVLGESPRRHLILERCDGKPIRCGWDALQTIKNENLGEDANVIEVFPATSNVVNEVNRRHFWEVAELPRGFGVD